MPPKPLLGAVMDADFTNIIAILVALISGTLALLQALAKGGKGRLLRVLIEAIERAARGYNRNQEIAQAALEALREQRYGDADVALCALVEEGGPYGHWASPKYQARMVSEAHGANVAMDLHQEVKRVTGNGH